VEPPHLGQVLPCESIAWPIYRLSVTDRQAGKKKKERADKT